MDKSEKLINIENELKSECNLVIKDMLERRTKIGALLVNAQGELVKEKTFDNWLKNAQLPFGRSQAYNILEWYKFQLEHPEKKQISFRDLKVMVKKKVSQENTESTEKEPQKKVGATNGITKKSVPEVIKPIINVEVQDKLEVALKEVQKLTEELNMVKKELYITEQKRLKISKLYNELKMKHFNEQADKEEEEEIGQQKEDLQIQKTRQELTSVGVTTELLDINIKHIDQYRYAPGMEAKAGVAEKMRQYYLNVGKERGITEEKALQRYEIIIGIAKQVVEDWKNKQKEDGLDGKMDETDSGVPTG